MTSTGGSAAAAHGDGIADAKGAWGVGRPAWPLADIAEDRPEQITAHPPMATDAASGDDTDRRCLARLRAADTSALGALYDRDGRHAFAVAHRITGCPEVAEAVVLEAFLILWRRADQFPPGFGDVRRWLLTTVRHRAIDHLRGRPSRPARWAEESGIRAEVRP